MERWKGSDPTDRSILKILSFYEHLGTLQLWYEVGEDDAAGESVTQEEILGRLESLMTQGFVKRLREEGGGSRWALRKGKSV